VRRHDPAEICGWDITQTAGSLTAANLKVISDSNVTLNQAANNVATVAANLRWRKGL